MSRRRQRAISESADSTPINSPAQDSPSEEVALPPLHKRQAEVSQCEARFRILVAGRRFGKTHLALTEMLRVAQAPGRLVWYVGPTEGQSKRIAWDRLKKLTRDQWAKRPNESELRIELKSGSIMVVSGGFKPDSLRGQGLDFLVLDEFASQRPEAWHEVFRPALADRKGRALFIGTPKGRNHFYDLVEFARSDPDWQVFQFSTLDGGIVDSDELNSAARQLDPESFRQEFEAEFTSVTRNRAYHTFDAKIHVRSCSVDPNLPLVWAIDFNVDPMCMLLMQRYGEVVEVIDEIIIRPDANTVRACEEFHRRVTALYQHLPFAKRPLTIDIYGDASGNQRRTSGTDTDWSLIRQFFSHWRGVYLPNQHLNKVNPAVRDRLNCVNARLRNQLGDARLFVDPRCRELILDLENVAWAVDSTGAPTAELNKSDRARTHASDALGYYISRVFSLRPTIGEQGNPLF